jgi:hypothetical protein
MMRLDELYTDSTGLPTTEPEIMRWICRCYGDLSPENVSCDGELSGEQIIIRSREITDTIAILENALGRSVTEDQAIAYCFHARHG